MFGHIGVVRARGGGGGGVGWYYHQNGMAFITYYTIVMRRNPQEIE